MKKLNGYSFLSPDELFEKIKQAIKTKDITIYSNSINDSLIIKSVYIGVGNAFNCTEMSTGINYVVSIDKLLYFIRKIDSHYSVVSFPHKTFNK